MLAQLCGQFRAQGGLAGGGFLLLPGDVVYAQTSTIADLGNLVELYVRRLLPFSLGGPALGTIN